MSPSFHKDAAKAGLVQVLQIGKVCVAIKYKCTAAGAGVGACCLPKIGDRSDERGTCRGATQAVRQKKR